MPPAKISVATGVDEFEIVAVTYGRAVDLKTFEPDFVLRLFIVPGECGTRILRVSHGRDAHATRVSQFKQSAFNLNHPANFLDCFWRRLHRRVKLIAQQMLYVVNEQLLMLHLVFEAEAHNAADRFGIIAIIDLIDESQHHFVDVRAIFFRFGDGWPRARAAFWPFNARAESFVVRIEVEKKLV